MQIKSWELAWNIDALAKLWAIILARIHNLIENDSSTSLPILIAHIKNTSKTLKDTPPRTTKHGWQSKRLLKTSTTIGKDRTTIYQDCCKLCSNFCEGNTVNVTTRRSTSKGFRHIPSFFLEFQYVYRWVLILQTRSSIDGIWCYCKCKGTFLVEIVMDDNNKIIPIVFTVVQSE